MKLLTCRKRGALMTGVGVLNISGEVIDLTAAYELLILDEGNDLYPPLALQAEGSHPVDFLNQPRPILFWEPDPKQALAEGRDLRPFSRCHLSDAGL